MYGIINSCKSPTKINPPDNNQLSVTISLNDSLLYLGDTLKISLLIKTNTYLNGSICFGDSNSISFIDHKGDLDTTILGDNFSD